MLTTWTAGTKDKLRKLFSSQSLLPAIVDSNQNMADGDVGSESSGHNLREIDDEENDKFLAQYFTKTPEYGENRSMFR